MTRYPGKLKLPVVVGVFRLRLRGGFRMTRYPGKLKLASLRMCRLGFDCWFRMTRYPGKLKLRAIEDPRCSEDLRVPDDSLSGEVET